MKRIFVSSVQKEFAEEREFLRRFIENNPILGRFFSVFTFESSVPATDKTTSEVYLDELSKCDICLVLIGNDYGYEDGKGISPTEREFEEATHLGLERLVMVKSENSQKRCQKERVFLQKVSSQLTWQKFSDRNELLTNVYASLDSILAHTGAYHLLPFDARPCDGATLKDIDENKVRWFIERSHNERGLPFPQTIPVYDILTHLKLIDQKTKTPLNAAILLFGINPQKFFISSEVKCAYWHTSERIKPIASYKVYHGTLFDLADQALDFIISKLDRRIGTREHGTTADASYEIPEKVIAEMIINSIAHRDYDSTGSVQIELFSNRILAMNPGRINPSIKPEELTKEHGSYPNNPLIADVLYQARYIEKMGSGTTDMIHLCREKGLKDPIFDMGLHSCSVSIFRPMCRTLLPTVEKTVEKTVEIILRTIRTSPYVSIRQLAEATGLTRRGIEWNISQLKAKNKIRRIGPDKGGRWEIVEEKNDEEN